MYSHPIFIFIRRIVYSILYAVSFIPTMRVPIVVLCYHAIGTDAWHYSTSIEDFSLQMNYLAKGYKPVILEDVYNHITGKKKLTAPSFVVTFDDGYKDILNALPVCENYNIKPTVFLLSDPTNANTAELENLRPFLNSEDISSLLLKGWRFGSHGAIHADFSSLSSAQIESEVVESKRVLQKNYLIDINFFAYPKGRYTESVIKEVKQAGYLAAFSVNDGFISSTTPLFTIPRIGVNRSHTFIEFVGLLSLPALYLRKFVKIILSLFKGSVL